MSETPTVRQRLLVRAGDIASLLDEIGHLPGDRLLVIDLDMTKPEHDEWLRRAVTRGISDTNPPNTSR